MAMGSQTLLIRRFSTADLESKSVFRVHMSCCDPCHLPIPTFGLLLFGVAFRGGVFLNHLGGSQNGPFHLLSAVWDMARVI